jgi:hypothetical protein
LAQKIALEPIRFDPAWRHGTHHPTALVEHNAVGAIRVTVERGTRRKA